MKILIHSLLILTAAALGLVAGFALRAKRASPASLSAAANLATPVRSPSPRMNAARDASQPQPNDDSPLASALEHGLAKTNGVTRWLLWSEAVERAKPSDFPRLAILAKDNPAALQFVAARWAEIAPRHFFDALVAAKGMRALPVQPLARVLFDEWPKQDPDGAIAALNEPGNPGIPRAWQMDVATTVINNDIERGLRLFSEWHIENYMPFYDERGPVPKWTAADPRHAAGVALQYPSSYLSAGVIKVIGEEWAKTDPAAALQFAGGTAGQLGSLLGTAALKSWAERDLNEAADWLAATD